MRLSSAWVRRRDVAPAVFGVVFFSACLAFFDPAPQKEPPRSSALYSADYELLGARAALDGQWRLEPSSILPLRFTQALVAYEDGRFFGHAGFDPYAILRAVVSNVEAGMVVSGGSTITMQTARLLRGHGSRTIAAKLVELWMSVRLEAFHSKAEILQIYASLAPFGGNVVGLEAAGFRWYGRPPQTLTWSEAATLAVLPNSPGLIHPGRSRSELGKKRDDLLTKLVDSSIVDEGDLSAALLEPLPLAPNPMPNLVPHLMSTSAGGTVVTTLEFALQERVLETARRHAVRLAGKGIRNLAVVVARVDDGTVAAYVGNGADFVQDADPRAAAWVDCAVAPRSSGSILKPFLYASMLDSGELSPARLVPDIPTRIGSYSPENNLKTYAGAVRADEALARSLNVPFVRLLRTYGVERFAALLRRLGFSTLTRAPADYGLTLVLGGAEVTLVDAVAAYTSLARIAKGTSIMSGLGLDVRQPPAVRSGEAPFSAGAAWLTLEALIDVARPGEEASWQEYASSQRVAWKTGTSFGSRDAWAIGVTTRYVVGVWAGNADGEGRPEIKGTDAAAPLLFDIMQLLQGSGWFQKSPDGLRIETVCTESGYVAGPDCVDTEHILVPAGAKTDMSCPYCRIIQVSEDGRYRVRAENPGTLGLRMESWFVLPPTMEWYFSRSTIGYSTLPPWAPGMAGPEPGVVEFISPEENAAIFVPIDLDGVPGKAVFRAAHRDDNARLFWHLDGEYLGETIGDHRMELRPGPGRHEMIVLDQYGGSAGRSFDVYPRE
jgi:penicillin-binding protein 1C